MEQGHIQMLQNIGTGVVANTFNMLCVKTITLHITLNKLFSLQLMEI